MMVGGLFRAASFEEEKKRIEKCHLASVSFQLGDMLLRNGILLQQASDHRGGLGESVKLPLLQDEHVLRILN